VITLTKTEIRWIINLVEKKRENCKELMNVPSKTVAALQQLEYENMTALTEKLEAVITSDNKRIAVKS